MRCSDYFSNCLDKIKEKWVDLKKILSDFYNQIIKKHLYFFYFLIGVIFKISILLTLTINFYTSRNDYVWFNSKILTINSIIQENYENYKIYQNFVDRNFYNALNFSYYDLLKNATRDNCGKDLKQCGILDTLGNKLCLYKDYPCPINEIIVDLENKEAYYKNKGFNDEKYHLLYQKSYYTFYYRNTSFDKKIISKLLWSVSQPKFLDNHTFIFDTEAFETKFENKIINLTEYINDKDTFSPNNNDNNNFVQLNFTKYIEGKEDVDIPVWYNVSRTRAKLIQNDNLQNYFEVKLNKTENNDNNYIKIHDKIYFRNFYGFENAEQNGYF